VRLRVVRLGPWLVLGLSCREVVPEDGVGDEGEWCGSGVSYANGLVTARKRYGDAYSVR